jgi:hypothetical protein
MPEMLWLDPYERHARLSPGLLALLPVAVDVLALSLRKVPIVSALASMLTTIGGPIVLAGLVRQRGLRLQEVLFRGWGGASTTRRLRLAGAEPNDAVRNQRRTHLEGLAATRLPTREEELREPESSDSRYDAAVAILREKTRDGGKFRLVSAENRSFGFERNLLAMRPVGLGVALGSLVVLAGAAVIKTLSAVPSIAPLDLGIGVLVDVAILGFWWRFPTDARVRLAGDKYADQLLNAAAVL